MDNLVRDSAPDDGRGSDGETGGGTSRPDGRRRRRPHGNARVISLTAVMAATALVVALLGVWGFSGGGQASPSTSITSYRDQHRLAAAVRASSGDPTCAAPTQQSVQQSVQLDVQTESEGEGGSIAGRSSRSSAWAPSASPRTKASGGC